MRVSAGIAQVILFGCGGHGRSVADVLLLNDPAVSIRFVDEQAGDGEMIHGFPVVRRIDHAGTPYFFALGDNRRRKEKFEEIGTAGLVSVISVKAHLGYGSTVGKGCFVANFCHIGPEATIGDNTIVNTSAVVEHEVTVGRHSHIAPRAVISGRSSVGDLVFVGAGAVVKDNVAICSDVIVGAGATVIRNIEKPGTYVGTPVRRIP
jgi:UDP-N-acetylbacillosamine N-acetyltransferase